jgi:hypothetical protein
MKPKINFKQIKKGNRGYLLNAIDNLVDYYEEDKFNNGYKSCLADMSVRAERLAEKIHKESDKRGKLGKDENGEPISYLEVEETAEIIEEYFEKALNKK